MKKLVVLIAMLVLSAIPVAAQAPQWWINLVGGCSDSDGGPKDPDVPVPFIGINGRARDKEGLQPDICIDEEGNQVDQSTRVRERRCENDKVVSNDYDCTKHGFLACVDPGQDRGAACVRVIPPPKKCGNKVLDPGEQCDPPGGACMTPAGAPGICNPACKCVKTPKKCGDKIVQKPAEDCDPPGSDCKDAKGNAGKCANNCKCRAPVCGDKKVEKPEECDPPGSDCVDAAGNKGKCTDKCGCRRKVDMPKCGNKVVEAPEECDPPGSACKTPDGKPGVCSEQCGCRPYVITPKCGNKMVEKPEECDPPGSACKTAAGLLGICAENCACKPTYEPPRCGNRKMDPGEQCDPPGAPAPGCPPIQLPGGGCGYPLCLEGCKCPTGRACPVPREPIPTELVPLQLTGQQPTTPTTAPKSCDQICAERGRTTQPTDHAQYIMSYLQNYRCVSGARITLPGTLTVTGPGIECKCYSKEPPRIEVDQTPPVCQTPCGPVKCGESTQCPCPGVPNCILTASCDWSGWSWQQNRPVPIFGAKSAQQAQQASSSDQMTRDASMLG